MKLLLKGHDYKYAVEQILLMMFPQERPEYVDALDGEGLSAEVKVSVGKVYATAVTRLFSEGKICRAESRIRTSTLKGKLARDRQLQKIVKLSFYRAAVEMTGAKPVWGALTGIRPGKLVSNMLEDGVPEPAAAKRLQQEYYVSPERAALCVDTARAGLAVKRALQPKDIALYIGIPFCPTRCAYCSFVSHSVEKSMKLIEPFLAALLQEIDAVSSLVKELGVRIISVYIGGGTPTTLSAPQLKILLDALKEKFDLSACSEFTVEAGRPDTITREKLRVLGDAGVHRLSINPQTMEDGVLAAIGRKHSAADIVEAYRAAREETRCAINMDLIAGLPTDTPDGFRRTLDAVMAMQPENITVHTLSLKKGTRITLGGEKLPTADDVGQMLDYASEKLRGGEYVPYYLYRQKFMSGGFENVGWSKPGYDSLYNIAIMEELCTIIAMGGGGSTKLVAPHSGRIERIFNAKYPYEYIRDIESIIKAKDGIRRFYREEML